jgi:ribosomal protein L7Ae-like RNA K-turn-binding protein
VGMSMTPGESEALSLLGLARRAGAVVPGVEATRRSLEAGRVRLVLLAADASETQYRKVRGLVRRRNVPVRRVSDKDMLGACVGRGTLSVVGVTSSSFVRLLLERLPPTPSGNAGALESEGDGRN